MKKLFISLTFCMLAHAPLLHSVRTPEGEDPATYDPSSYCGPETYDMLAPSEAGAGTYFSVYHNWGEAKSNLQDADPQAQIVKCKEFLWDYPQSSYAEAVVRLMAGANARMQIQCEMQQLKREFEERERKQEKAQTEYAALASELQLLKD